MKKRLLSMFLTLCTLICLVPTGVFAEGETTEIVAAKQELVDALAEDTALRSVAVQSIGPNEAEVELDLYEKMSAQVSVIKLISDIELGICLPIDYEVTLDLNGHVLKMADDASGSVIKIGSTGNLTLIDSNPTAEHKFKVNGTDPWVLDETGGTETVKGGIITGGTGSWIDSAGEYNTISDDNICGGGVLIEKGGKLTMTGGNIVGCTAAGKNAYGGGVFVRIGVTLNISGGVTIIGCTAGEYKRSDAMFIYAYNDSSVTGGTFYGSITDNGGKITGITVKYHLNSSENYATQVVQSGDTIGVLDPAKSGHTFDGWYKATARSGTPLPPSPKTSPLPAGCTLP